jgi:hypothetical protein
LSRKSLPELHGGGGVDVLVPHRDGDGGLLHLLLQGADQFLLLVALHDLTSFSARSLFPLAQLQVSAGNHF